MDDKIAFYCDAINTFVGVGRELMATLRKKDPIDRRDILVFVFTRKTLRLIEALRTLLAEDYTEESQILARALLETKFAFDYVLKMREHYDQLLERYIDSLFLDKLRQLTATNWEICPDKAVKNSYLQREKDIRNRYDQNVLRNLKRYGLVGLSVAETAKVTDNMDLYNMAYRLYSRNTHFTDGNEHLLQLLSTQDEILNYQESRFAMILEVIFLSGRSVLQGANQWLGDPVALCDEDFPNAPPLA